MASSKDSVGVCCCYHCYCYYYYYDHAHILGGTESSLNCTRNIVKAISFAMMTHEARYHQNSPLSPGCSTECPMWHIYALCLLLSFPANFLPWKSCSWTGGIRHRALLSTLPLEPMRVWGKPGRQNRPEHIYLWTKCPWPDWCQYCLPSLRRGRSHVPRRTPGRTWALPMSASGEQKTRGRRKEKKLGAKENQRGHEGMMDKRPHDPAITCLHVGQGRLSHSTQETRQGMSTAALLMLDKLEVTSQTAFWATGGKTGPINRRIFIQWNSAQKWRDWTTTAYNTDGSWNTIMSEKKLAPEGCMWNDTSFINPRLNETT